MPLLVQRRYGSGPPFDMVIGTRKTREWLRSVPIQTEDTDPRLWQYDISVRCRTCQQTLFERHRYGVENHQRDSEKAQEIVRSAGAMHPGHEIVENVAPRP
jgi:hypothetical protein